MRSRHRSAAFITVAIRNHALDTHAQCGQAYRRTVIRERCQLVFGIHRNHTKQLRDMCGTVWGGIGCVVASSGYHNHLIRYGLVDCPIQIVGIRCNTGFGG